jgi:hypothetical protein
MTRLQDNISDLLPCSTFPHPASKAPWPKNAPLHAAFSLKNRRLGVKIGANRTQIAPAESFALRLVALQPIGKSLIYIVSRVFGVFGRDLKGLRANRCTIAAWSENDFHNYKGNAENPPFCRDLNRSVVYAKRCCAAA